MSPAIPVSQANANALRTQQQNTQNTFTTSPHTPNKFQAVSPRCPAYIFCPTLTRYFPYIYGLIHTVFHQVKDMV
jgi:hypothetical protein